MPWLCGIGVWFALSVPVGVFIGKLIKFGNPSSEEIGDALQHGSLG